MKIFLNNGFSINMKIIFISPPCSLQVSVTDGKSAPMDASSFAVTGENIVNLNLDKGPFISKVKTVDILKHVVN